MHHHFVINGYPVAYGVLVAGAGAALWHYRRLHRVAMAAFGFAAVLLTIGIVPWFDALARLTSGGPGTIVMLIVAMFAALGFVHEMRSRRKDARVHAHMCAVILGTSLVLILGNAARLLSEAAHSPARTGTAVARSVQALRSGTAAHAQSSHQAAVIVVLALALIVFAIAFGRRHERRPMPGSSGPKALPPGGSMGLPSGKRGG